MLGNFVPDDLDYVSMSGVSGVSLYSEIFICCYFLAVFILIPSLFTIFNSLMS